MEDEDPQQNGAPLPDGGGTPPAGAPGQSGTPAKRSPAEHLTPHRFPKGKSGNPGGRPKGRSITAALRKLADTDHNGKAVAEVLAEVLMKHALSGKFPFAKEVLDRIDGKVPDKALVETKGEQKVFICAVPGVIGGKVVKRPELPPEEEDGEE